MKIQCSCGTKYDFEVTPDMVANPIKFVCQNCGADSSEFVNELIRQQFAGTNVTVAPSTAPAPPPLPSLASPLTEMAPPPPSHTGLRISREAAPAPAAASAVESQFCPRHRGEKVIDRCVVCHKPICGQCQDIFGNTCSPPCKSKAADQGLAIPGKHSRSQSREEQLWQKTGWIFGTAGISVVVFLVLWTWYAWYGSVAHSYFSTSFPVRAYSGDVVLMDSRQLIFLHGGTLARYQLRNSKPAWSLELVTDDQVKQAIAEAKKMDPDFGSKDTPEELDKTVRHDLASTLGLHVFQHNIWVSSPGKLTHYDWNTGAVVKEIATPNDEETMAQNNGELEILAQSDSGENQVTHVDLASDEVRTETFPSLDTSRTNTTALAQNAKSPAQSRGANGRTLNPQNIAQEAGNLPLPARIALPALLGNEIHRQQVNDALADDNSGRASRALNQANAENNENATPFNLIIGPYDGVQMATKLLEERYAEHDAMKAPAKKRVADGDISTGNENAAINQTLNDMQRANGGNMVRENISLYQVTLRDATGSNSSEWTGQVTGVPWVYPLKTVNVLTAGKQVIVLDKSNHKLWEATLANNVNSDESLEDRFMGQNTKYGAGPCVERGNTLYVADQVVLTAFDLASGNVRWRLPSVGVVGLFFDDQGNLYVNTTSGSPDDIRYSKQIDIERKIQAVLIKLNPQTGTVLWKTQPGGFISYVHGKYIYTLQTHDPNPFDEDIGDDTIRSLQTPAYMRLARIRASDGRVLWEIQRDGSPLAVNFSDNTIALVFKDSVQVLKYISL